MMLALIIFSPQHEVRPGALGRCQDQPCIPEALDDLSEVCEIFAKTHGVHAEVCAEPFFYYGKALLEMSKIESAVLGNCLEGFDSRLLLWVQGSIYVNCFES